MSKTQIAGETRIPQIIITREFDAPRDLVFRAYIEPRTCWGSGWAPVTWR